MSEDPERESSPVVVPVRDDGTVCVERQDGPVTLRLMDAPLWLAFRQEGTEMIITKAGRRMFPFVMVKVEGLSPTLLYSVYLSLVPCDHRQYKFCQRRWVKVSDATTGPTPTPEQAYVHPASPNRGSFWCQEMISFAKLKITNNKHSQGDIVLQSMRKYMAQITVREDLRETQYVFPLPETTFVAVTQYQNEAVTRMKIAHNPFANGFKSEDGKKLFSRSDLSGIHASKPQRSASTTGKSSTKAVRVKATLSPQTLAPVILSTHGAHDLKLVSATLSLPTSLQPPHFSPALAMEAKPNPGPCLSLPEILSGGFSMSHTATVSPYVFRSEASSSPREESELRGMGLRPFRAAEASPETGGCSPDGDSRGRESVSDEEEEDCDDSFAKAASPTVPVPITTLPTTIADSKENTAGDTTTVDSNDSENADGSDEQSISLKSSSKGHLVGGLNVFSSFHSSPGLPANLSKKGGHFKQPLPRKGVVSGRKGEKRHLAGVEGSASGVAVVAADSDMDWYQVRQGAADLAVKHDRGVQLKLHDGHIWHSFAACGSKIVISAEGRNMFPVISVSLRGLDPGRLYSVWLHVTAADGNAIYSSQARDQPLWGASRLPFTTPSVKPYMHPSSPMRGLAWMKAKVNFSEVRLTALTSDSDHAVGKSLSVQAGCRYLTEIVVREEEEVTPNGSGLISNIYFFPLPEVTFLTNLESEESKSTHPVASSDHCTSDTHPVASSDHCTSDHCTSDTRKRFRENSDSFLDEESGEIDVAALPSAKVSRGDVDSGQWMRSPVVLPRHADLSPLLSQQQDLSPLLPRQPDLCSRINPFYCFPPMSTLPPAHVGLLANRMPLPVTSPLQSITSFPFHPQLFPQLRTPMHTAFGLPLSPVNPFPYIYYPYSLPPTTLPSATASEASRGLDLSLKCSESR